MDKWQEVIDLLVPRVNDAVESGLKLPMYVIMVEKSGQFVGLKYWKGPEQEIKGMSIFEHDENDEERLPAPPINYFFIDSNGSSWQALLVESGDFKSLTNALIHN